MRAAREQCDEVIVSLFVNPAQFEEAGGPRRLPAHGGEDAAIAAGLGVDALFAPGVEEIYPAGFATTVRVGGLADVLEGAERGARHFDGVCTVVCKLLEHRRARRRVLRPEGRPAGRGRAAAWCAISRSRSRLQIVPTVREPDGLALSSRNARLDAAERERAVALARGLEAVRDAVERGERDPAAAVAAGRAAMAADTACSPNTSPSSTRTPRRVLREIAGRVLVVVAARVGPAQADRQRPDRHRAGGDPRIAGANHAKEQRDVHTAPIRRPGDARRAVRSRSPSSARCARWASRS